MPVTVTIVEDPAIDSLAIAEGLGRDARVEVLDVCPDALTGIDAMGRHEPQVVLLDLPLPDVDGPHLISRLRGLHPRVRVVVRSASERPTQVLAALRAGADGYTLRRQTTREIADGIIAVAQGGTVLAPQIARSVLDPRAGIPRNAHETLVRLEPTDAEIVRMVVSGDTDDQIAQTLFLSPRTVQNRLTRIRRIAHVQRRMELARWAVENELV